MHPEIFAICQFADATNGVLVLQNPGDTLAQARFPSDATTFFVALRLRLARHEFGLHTFTCHFTHHNGLPAGPSVRFQGNVKQEGTLPTAAIQFALNCCL
jgi:hypothetical protein